MKKKKIFGLVATAVLASAALTAVFLGVPADNPGGTAIYSGDQITGDSNINPAASETAPGQTVGDSDASQESIQVHGNWTIEVRQPDGSFVSSYQFHNDLTSDGSAILANILARNRTVARWQVALSPGLSTVTSPFTSSEGGPDATGFLYEEDYEGAAFNCFNTLTVSVPGSGDNAGKLVLSGMATAAQDGTINVVSTALLTSDPDIAPADTSYSGPLLLAYSFTSKGTDTPMAVAVDAGQVILVTVVIDFS